LVHQIHRRNVRSSRINGSEIDRDTETPICGQPANTVDAEDFAIGFLGRGVDFVCVSEVIGLVRVEVEPLVGVDVRV
jgi:hypothetical protein